MLPPSLTIPQAMSPTSSSSALRVPVPTSPWAPRITSIVDGSIVHSKLVIVMGEINEPQARPIDGNVTVHHDRDGLSFPPTDWPAADGYFKAMVYLSPGWNKLRFDFTSPKLSTSQSGSPSIHSSYMMLNYLPLNNVPPLQLVILLAKDSPATYDATPARREHEGNGLEIAIRKFRMCAHLWQSFTAEQMYRHRFGRRTFRFEEEWQRGSLSIRDWEAYTMKNETRVHVVRSEATVAELRREGSDLYGIAGTAVRKHFNITTDSARQYAAVLLLDSHWDKSANRMSAHCALGGMGGDLCLAVFGGCAIQSYPSCVEEITPAFMDCTKTDTNHVANDAGESGSSWEAANIGIGAHMHEVGHLLGCPHQENGVMLRDYVTLNRTFCISEPYSTRTREKGRKVCKQEDECTWHRLDALRFRYHPCFRLPGDEAYLQSDDDIQYYGIDGGRLIVTSNSGIVAVELRWDDEDLAFIWMEYLNSDPRNTALPRQITLTEADLRAKLPEDKKKCRINLKVLSASSGFMDIKDFNEVTSSKNILVLPPLKASTKDDQSMMMNMMGRSFGDKRLGFRSRKLGLGGLGGHEEIQTILSSAVYQTSLLVCITVHAGGALDGIEFKYEDGTSQLFGRSGGQPHEFWLGKRREKLCFSVRLTSTDTRRGETLLGMAVRCGAWLDGVELFTSTGRRSGHFGSSGGGL